MSDRLAALRPGRDELVDAVALFTFTVVALVSFHSSYGGTGFLVVGTIGAVAGLVIAHLGHQLRWPLVVTVAIAVASYTVVCSMLALRHHAIAGVIPTPNALLESLTTAVTGWKELITTVPPVGATGDLLVLPVLAGMASAFASYTLARRVGFAGLAVLPSMIVLGLGIAVGIDEPVSVVVHGAVFAALVVAWLAWREHRRRPLLQGVGVHGRQLASSVMVLAIAGATGLILAPSLPGAESSSRDIWRQTVTPPFDPRQYPSPLNGYRSYVKLGTDANGEREEPEVMFTIEGLPERVPVRLATMDAYDGLVWQVSAGAADNPSLDDSGSFERIGASLQPEFDGERATVVVTIDQYSDVWVPDVGEVISITFTGSAGGPERDRALANSFRYNRATDTGATVMRLTEGDRYEMTVSLPPILDDVQGRIVNPDVPRIGQARSVAEIPQQLAGPDLLVINDTAERLDRVRDTMIRTGAYSDGDIDAGQIRAKAGHSAVRLVEFVQDYPRSPFVGNAEQYASTYALLFRDIDRLPTRVVMGFMPSRGSLDEPVEVLATEAEAWVEVPIVDLGWVGIFPTPPRDQIASTSSSPQQPEPDYRTQNPPPPPLVDPEFDQPATASGKAQAPQPDVEADAQAPEPDSDAPTLGEIVSRPIVVATGVALSPFVLAALLCAAVVWLKARRRRRRRRRGLPHQRIANGWLEVTDLAVDMGRPVPPTTTRREASQFAGDATTSLATQTDAAVWGGDDLSDEEVEQYWAQLHSTLEQMKSELGPIDRFKANVSLRSLKRRSVSSRSGGRRG